MEQKQLSTKTFSTGITFDQFIQQSEKICSIDLGNQFEISINDTAPNMFYPITDYYSLEITYQNLCQEQDLQPTENITFYFYYD
jgi:hypothetical protein